MMKPLLLLLFLLFSMLPATAQAPVRKVVSFLLHAPGLPDTAQVYITGNAPALGSWNPSKVPMKRTAPDTWEQEVFLSEPMLLEYKYTLGSWQLEAADSTGKPLPNFTVKVESSLQVKNQVTNWRSSGAEEPVRGGVTGQLVQHQRIGTGQPVPPRDLTVWLPPTYEQDKRKHYPVLYMHDGQNLFDPNTSAFGVDWRLDETADSLIRAGVMEPIIIVGIHNNQDRMQEYAPGEKGAAYMDYVLNTVKPFIDSAYRTRPGAKYTATGGSSAGGTIAFMLAWEHPEVFSKAICMSPAFKIQHIDYVDDVQAHKGKKKPVYFYMDNGGVELEEQLQPGIDEMLQTLKQKGYREGKDYTWMKDEKARHFESAWGKRMPQALKLLFPAK